VSGLVGKRVLADVPGLGEVMARASCPCRIRARSRALASRGTSLLRGVGLRLASRPAVLFGRHLTVNSELARTRRIRLSN
jgi:hypothetical protein